MRKSVLHIFNPCTPCKSESPNNNQQSNKNRNGHCILRKENHYRYVLNFVLCSFIIAGSNCGCNLMVKYEHELLFNFPYYHITQQYSPLCLFVLKVHYHMTKRKYSFLNCKHSCGFVCIWKIFRRLLRNPSR